MDENTLDILEFAGCAASTASMDRTPLIHTNIMGKYFNHFSYLVENTLIL